MSVLQGFTRVYNIFVCSASEEQIVDLREEEPPVQHEGIVRHFVRINLTLLKCCGFFFLLSFPVTIRDNACE